MTPTTGLTKTEWGPISTSGTLLSVCHQTGRSRRKNRDTSAISNGVAMLLRAVTTPVRALVQTGGPPKLNAVEHPWPKGLLAPSPLGSDFLGTIELTTPGRIKPAPGTL